jgi:hypothetical protein
MNLLLTTLKWAGVSALCIGFLALVGNAFATNEGAIEGTMVLGAIAALYLLPAFYAASRKHHNARAIWVTTILLGWTGLGWVVALIWAFTNPPAIYQHENHHHYRDRIAAGE